MPISEEVFKRFWDKRVAPGSTEFSFRFLALSEFLDAKYQGSSGGTCGRFYDFVALSITAPEGAESGLGRILAKRLVGEGGWHSDRFVPGKGYYVDDENVQIGNFPPVKRTVFAVRCAQDDQLEPALDKLRSLKIEYIRMIDRIYNTFKPKSL